MKMKRINAIIKGKAPKMTDTLSRKVSRILRNVDQAIDYAEDQIDIALEKAETLIDSLGLTADANRINAYVEAVKTMDEWKNTLKTLKELKEKLNSEVEVDNTQEEE